MIFVNKNKRKTLAIKWRETHKNKTDFYFLLFCFFFFYFHFIISSLHWPTRRILDVNIHLTRSKINKRNEKKIFFYQNKLCLPHKHNNYTNTHTHKLEKRERERDEILALKPVPEIIITTKTLKREQEEFFSD